MFILIAAFLCLGLHHNNPTGSVQPFRTEAYSVDESLKRHHEKFSRSPASQPCVIEFTFCHLHALATACRILCPLYLGAKFNTARPTNEPHEQEESTISWSDRYSFLKTREIIWIVIGLAGQMLFASRMLVQWIASERQKQSVIPVAFWWLSLSGGIVLIAYFVHRRDIVGILGQFLPLVIYLRNLYLICRHKKAQFEP